MTFIGWLLGHEGHLHGNTLLWVRWIGGLHLLFFHFPITLVVMTALSEVLFVRYQKIFFDTLSRCMLASAAAFALPTALFGVIYSYAASYTGTLVNLLKWHMWTGISTALLIIFAL